eukprot:scaffold7541_cov116-Isochrysis_galbana.AAC.3
MATPPRGPSLSESDPTTHSSRAAAYSSTGVFSIIRHDTARCAARPRHSRGRSALLPAAPALRDSCRVVQFACDKAGS